MRYLAMPDRDTVAILAKLNADKLNIKKQINALNVQIRNSEPGIQVEDKILQKGLLEEILNSINQNIELHKQ